MGASLPGQLPPSVQETARDCQQGPLSCQDNCLLLGSVAKVNPSPGTASRDKLVFPRPTLLFCYLIPDWWWDPGNPQFHSPPPLTCSLFPQPYVSIPTTVRTLPRHQHRPCGEWLPLPQGHSPTTARARLVPCPWGPARNLSELKQDLGARLSDDGVRDAEAPPSHPSSSSDSSGHSLSSDSRWLPDVRCSGATTALSLAKEVIKELSFSCCLWVSLLS